MHSVNLFDDECMDKNFELSLKMDIIDRKIRDF